MKYLVAAIILSASCKSLQMRYYDDFANKIEEQNQAIDTLIKKVLDLEPDNRPVYILKNYMTDETVFDSALIKTGDEVCDLFQKIKSDSLLSIDQYEIKICQYDGRNKYYFFIRKESIGDAFDENFHHIIGDGCAPVFGSEIDYLYLIKLRTNRSKLIFIAKAVM